MQPVRARPGGTLRASRGCQHALHADSVVARVRALGQGVTTRQRLLAALRHGERQELAGREGRQRGPVHGLQVKGADGVGRVLILAASDRELAPAIPRGVLRHSDAWCRRHGCRDAAPLPERERHGQDDLQREHGGDVGQEQRCAHPWARATSARSAARNAKVTGARRDVMERARRRCGGRRADSSRSRTSCWGWAPRGRSGSVGELRGRANTSTVGATLRPRRTRSGRPGVGLPVRRRVGRCAGRPRPRAVRARPRCARIASRSCSCLTRADP